MLGTASGFGINHNSNHCELASTYPGCLGRIVSTTYKSGTYNA